MMTNINLNEFKPSDDGSNTTNGVPYEGFSPTNGCSACAVACPIFALRNPKSELIAEAVLTESGETLEVLFRSDYREIIQQTFGAVPAEPRSITQPTLL